MERPPLGNLNGEFPLKPKLVGWSLSCSRRGCRNELGDGVAVRLDLRREGDETVGEVEAENTPNLGVERNSLYAHVQDLQVLLDGSVCLTPLLKTAYVIMRTT